jgi:FkbM family methyltransferase
MTLKKGQNITSELVPAELKIEPTPDPLLLPCGQKAVGRMDTLLEDLRDRGLRCAVIFDVGAHRASWSRMAQQIFADAHFTLIEPLLEMQEELEHFCVEHPGSRYFLAGAGARKGELTLTIPDDLAGSSFLPAPDENQLTDGRQRIVPIITIDDVIAQSPPIPDLMKLDIQGFELEALKGASTTFGRTAAYILEVSLFSFSDVPGMPEFYEVVRFMKERGYVVYDFPGFLRRPLDGALGQCDVCFVEENGRFRTSHDWE